MSSGCTASDSLLVSVNHVPAVYLRNDTSFCAGQLLTLDAGGGFDSYQWSTGAVTEKITVNNTGIYSVKATANTCAAYDTLKALNVYPLPSFSLGNDTTLCEGKQMQYSFDIQKTSYIWGTGSKADAISTAQPGTYWLTVTQNGCRSSDTVKVNFEQSPVVHLGNDTTVCQGKTILLTAHNTGAEYKWQDGSTNSAYLVKSAGIYFVTASINGCIAADTININYIPILYFTLGRDTFICKGGQLLLNPQVNTPVNYLWQDGSRASSFAVAAAATYILTASNGCGTHTDSITITTGLCNLLVPDAFTPNMDGVNDIFRVKYPFPVKKFRMAIFNRWGQKIYESGDILQGWDGTLNGINQPVGTYIWMIELTDLQNSQQQAHGTITLVR